MSKWVSLMLVNSFVENEKWNSGSGLMVSLLKGTSTDGSDVSHPQVFRTRCSLWFVSSAFFTQKSPQSRSLLLISIDLSELDQIGKLLQRTTPCPLGSANHAHTRASVLICLPMPLALLCLSSNRCHWICNLSKKLAIWLRWPVLMQNGLNPPISQLRVKT